ncbi:PIN domain-like protein [Suillus ampliporus]|nr:PIN domain-like protein [Suillus ampliporus]
MPLVSLTIQGHYKGPAPHVPYVVGVDASAWFEQCQQGRWHRAHAQMGQNPALQTFLFCLAHLARLPVQLVFTFNSNQSIQAAGEAEAQLVQMNSTGVIDAVMMDDSDAFVFGAHTVLRNSTFSIDSMVKLYTASAIQEHVDCHLTGDRFLTLAICCGGDYDKKGLVGCGHETALGLARCVNAALMGLCNNGGMPLGIILWMTPLEKWDVLTLRLHARFPDLFPDPHVVDFFPFSNPPPLPNIAPLASLVQQLLGWESKKVISTFRSMIWPVVVLHEVLEDLANNSPSSDEVQIALAPACTRAVFQSHAVRPKKALAGVPGHNNDVPTHDLEQSTLHLRIIPAPQTAPLSSATIIDLTHDDEAEVVSHVMDLTQDSDGDDVVPWSAGASHNFIDLTL